MSSLATDVNGAKTVSGVNNASSTELASTSAVAVAVGVGAESGDSSATAINVEGFLGPSSKSSTEAEGEASERALHANAIPARRLSRKAGQRGPAQ